MRWTEFLSTSMEGQEMAAGPRDKIVSDLRDEEKRISAAAQEAREKAKAFEAELKGVQSALAALTGESKRTTKKKAIQDAKPSPVNDEAKPSPKRKKPPQGTTGKSSKPTSDDAA